MNLAGRGVTAPLAGGLAALAQARAAAGSLRPASEALPRAVSRDLDFSTRALDRRLGDEANRGAGFSRRG
ncbi:MAG: hypothetical protein VKO64_04870 [Candidatus Sericytochromatia bacterium]|nr:hypothetical protein [Candidatus Sericytochromatia bacterium]